MCRRRSSVALIAGLALAAACSSEPGEVVRAREVLAEKTAQDVGYHEYALSVTAGSTAAHARALRIEAVSQGNRTVVAEALHALGDPLDAETAAAVRLAFGKTGSVKLAAAAVLARDGDAEAVEWLAAQLSQTGYLLSTPAMVALVETEHEEAVRESLAGLVGNEDISIRNEGYEILGAVRRPWAVQLLLDGLKAEFGEQRSGPIAALGRCGDPGVARDIRAWVGTQGLVLASLQALGELGYTDAMESVAPMLAHDQPLVRVYAAVAAVRLGALDAGAATVDGLLTEEDAGIRSDLAVQLASVEDAAATGWLLSLTGDSDKLVRAEAFRSLNGRAAPGLTEALAAGAQDASYEVATVALTGLAGAGDPSHVAALVPLLDSDNPYVAICAAHAVLSLAGNQGEAKVD